jgi:hypothetical protein
MNEHQPLEDLAAEAPIGGPRSADDVLAVVRRRRRRGWTIVGASAAAVLVAVAVPIAVQLARSDNTSAVSGPSVGRSSSPIHVGRGPLPPSDTAQIYAAALKNTVGSSRGVGGTSRTEVRQSTCTNLDIPTSLNCQGERTIPAQTRSEVLTLLADGNGIRFVDGPATNPPGSKTVLFVTLGPARISGTHARVFVQSWCGFDCVQGQGLILTVVDGLWQVTDTYAGYIS